MEPRGGSGNATGRRRWNEVFMYVPNDRWHSAEEKKGRCDAGGSSRDGGDWSTVPVAVDNVPGVCSGAKRMGDQKAQSNLRGPKI